MSKPHCLVANSSPQRDKGDESVNTMTIPLYNPKRSTVRHHNTMIPPPSSSPLQSFLTNKTNRHSSPTFTPPHSTTTATTSMGCVPSRPSPTYYSRYFKPVQPTRQALADTYEYQDCRQRNVRNVAADRYEDAYEQLTARSKLSKAHGLEVYCEDRGWG